LLLEGKTRSPEAPAKVHRKGRKSQTHQDRGDGHVLSILAKEKLEQLLSQGNLDTTKAYSLVQVFKEGYQSRTPSWAGKLFGHWVHLCTQSKISELLKLAQAIWSHLRGIVAFFRHRFTNAMLEGLHSKLRAISKRSYGFKTFWYLRIMILLAFGKLNLNVLSLG